ncbi:Bgt-5379, partial [Blumeria graminis f. sp. tritici]
IVAFGPRRRGRRLPLVLYHLPVTAGSCQKHIHRRPHAPPSLSLLLPPLVLAPSPLKF